MKLNLCFLIVILSIIGGTFCRKPFTSGKCYVLALEGGGDKGAYQVGALKGLVDNVPDREVEWDVITGISVGAINAGGLAIFEIGQESEAADFLVNTWKEIKGNSDVFQNWWLGPLYGLFYKTGLYDTTPLSKLLAAEIKDNDAKRGFVCGATNFVTGNLDSWDDINLNKEEYQSAILSSASYPVVFPLTNFRNNTYMDGGVKVSVDIAGGINKCIENGFKDESIVVDVVLLNSKVLPEQSSNGVHPLEILMRLFSIWGYDNAMRDFDYVKRVFPKVNYRYIVSPTKQLPSGPIPLTFSPSQLQKMIDIGMDDAKNVVKMGPGNNFDSLLGAFNSERQAVLGRKQTNSNLNTKNEDKALSEKLETAQSEELKFLS